MAVTMGPAHARQGREPGTWSAGSAEDQQLVVAVQDGRLSVRTGAVPLAGVLRAIENATDLSVTIKGDLGNVRAQAFRDLTLDEGLRRLVGDRHALVMFYSPDPEWSGPRVLKEVRVYGSAWQEHQTENEKSLAPAPSRGARTGGVEDGTPAVSYLYDSNNAGREEAAKLLEEDSDDVVQALTAALDDPEGEVRLRALRALPALQGEDALAHLSRVARIDPHPELRQAAIYMLAGFASDHARQVLQAALADPDGRVRQAAAQTLSQLRAR